MTVINAASKFVNSGQIPAVIINQNLHRLIKMIPWQLPATHGKDTFIVILGGLLIENFASNGRKWLIGSGSTVALTNDEVASRCLAELFFRASKIDQT